ncbi:MAG TPA: apolipoprotein N-acyltransferase [Chthoniobacterales bacterium]
MSLLVRSWPILGAALSGILMLLCFPPFEQDWFAWLALSPLLAAIWFRTNSQLGRLALGYLSGVLFFGATFYWIGKASILGWLALTLYLPVYPAIWAWFAGLPACRLRFDGSPLDPGDRLAPWRRSVTSVTVAMVLAAGWVILEWTRGWLFSGFGWNGLGVALHGNIPFIQLAGIGGVPLLSFLVVFGNVIAVTTVSRLIAEAGRLTWASRSDFTVALAIVLVAFGQGVRMSLETVDTRKMKVALVQAAAGDDAKSFDEYLQLSVLASVQKPDLIVWPEGAPGKPLLDNIATFGAAAKAAVPESGNIWLLTGSDEHAPDGSYNSAFAIAPGGSGLQTYRKRHLIPFYETGSEGYTPGKSSKPLWIMNANANLGALICIEDTIPELARTNARDRANVLVNLTNDGIFDDRVAERQHFLNAIFRAPETGLPLIRCANTGVTAIVDRQGRVTQQLEAGSPGILTGEIHFPVSGARTFHTQWGDWFVAACAGIVVLRLIVPR